MIDELSPQKQEDLYKSWMSKISDALRREKAYRKEASNCVEIYEARKSAENPFPILYSNTETLQPAIYNATPVPVVERRFRDEDPLGKVASEVGTRMLKYLLDVESDEYDNFDELIQPAVLDALITNRGLTRFKYQAHIENEQVQSECVYGEAVRWDKFLHGHARTWRKVPWICFEWDMSKQEIQANFGEELAGLCEFTSQEVDEENRSGETKQELTGVKSTKVYEIWDKASRKVVFICTGLKTRPMKMVEDPLKLAGFFPIPKPLNFMRKVTTLIPTPLFIQYKAQADELNSITIRLRWLIKALKIRGFYNSTIEGIEKVLDAEDNVLVPAENMASMPDGTGVDKTIWLMPIAELASVVQSLYGQREQIKGVIYEITGISDILRGSSVASETATAQNIKNQWGTLRLKKMQKEAQRYCRDCLRIILEIGVTTFSSETISAMTGLKYPTAEQKAQAMLLMQQYQAMAQQAQQMQQMQPPTGLPGQPAPQMPQLPPPPAEAIQAAKSPSWEEILELLRNDTLRSYRVDIETNSTIDAEASQDKQEISELLNALSQFLNGVAPLVQNGSMPFDVAKNIMLAISRRFAFGSQLEDSLNAMKAPEPLPQEASDPAAGVKLEAIKAKAMADQAKSQAEAQQSQLDTQIAQMEFQNKKDLMILEAQIAERELQLRAQQLDLDRQSLEMKSDFARTQHALRLAKLQEPSNATV